MADLAKFSLVLYGMEIFDGLTYIISEFDTVYAEEGSLVEMHFTWIFLYTVQQICIIVFINICNDPIIPFQPKAGWFCNQSGMALFSSFFVVQHASFHVNEMRYGI